MICVCKDTAFLRVGKGNGGKRELIIKLFVIYIWWLLIHIIIYIGRKKCLFVELSDSFRCFSEFVIIFAK